MSLKEIRNEIDEIDEQIVNLFTKRMECSRKVAEHKMENGLPIFNLERENLILDSVYNQAGKYGDSAKILYSAIMELSRALQHDMLGSGENLRNEILNSYSEIPFNSPNIKVACFGVPGTYAHKATQKIFPNSNPQFCTHFRDVFSAIQNNEAEFGVIPIENSSAGSVTDVYDLMLQYRFYIAAEADIAVNHCLAAKIGTSMSDVKRVYSHQQAIAQCSDFINSHSLIAETYVSTAAAAKMLSEQGGSDSAVICSEDAAEKYGLNIILRGFQNNPNNCTRFIVISKRMFISENADKISLCFSLPHVTGSLYSALCRFAVHGLNLTKIESRPMFGKSFEYLFYLDFTGNIKDKSVLNLLCALSDELAEFSFLGNYKEV